MSALPRLKRRREFLLVAAQGRKWAAPGLILQASPQSAAAGPPEPAVTLPPLRIGFTVSRKVGNAVVRNRVRRRLRAAAETVMPARARPGFDYVVIGRQASLTRPFPALVQDLEVALRKVRAERGGPDHAAAQPPARTNRPSDKDEDKRRM